jgi:hypothetical protein
MSDPNPLFYPDHLDPDCSGHISQENANEFMDKVADLLSDVDTDVDAVESDVANLQAQVGVFVFQDWASYTPNAVSWSNAEMTVVDAKYRRIGNDIEYDIDITFPLGDPAETVDLVIDLPPGLVVNESLVQIGEDSHILGISSFAYDNANLMTVGFCFLESNTSVRVTYFNGQNAQPVSNIAPSTIDAYTVFHVRGTVPVVFP